MGIKEFEDIEGLITEIIYDKKTQNILSRRFPVRLIFLQRFETFRFLIEKMASLNIEIYHLERDLPKPDGWITKDSLIHVVSSLEDNTAVVPFSEIIRFYSRPDFKNFFNRLLLIENSSDLSRRIYLPLIGIEQRFEKEFFQSFSRKYECAPIWGISKEDPNSIKVLLYTNQLKSKIKNYELLENTEEWLKFWKMRSPCNVVCCSKPLNLFYKNTLPDTIFSIYQFNNPKELIEGIYKKEIPILFVENERNLWNQLLDLISNDFDNFNSFVKNYFMVTTLTVKTILDIWLKTDNLFEKWLLKNFILSQQCLKQKYIFKVFESISDYSDHTLLRNLFLTIFAQETKAEFIDDRFELIKQFAYHKPVNLCDEAINELKGKIKTLPDSDQALLLTTGLLQIEKDLIFEFFANKQDTNLEILSQRYPDISNYLSTATFDNIEKEQEWVYEYIKEYKESKITNNVTTRLIELISELNDTNISFYNWYNSFESIQSIIHSNKVDKVFWIDALGVEWTAFIENYINQSGNELKVIKNIVGVANLPTSTEHNRISDSKYIQDFDRFVHNNLYSYPNSIINEFNELKNIIDLNLTLDSNQTVAIVSDHGLTTLSRLFESKKYGKNDSHEGRFIEVSSKEHTEDSDYLIHKSEMDEKHYLIALKHSSLGKKPLREVHGGCTPEEVLVPLILISNKKKTYRGDYLISIHHTEIHKSDPFVLFEISPTPKFVKIIVAGKTQKLGFKEDNNVWVAEIDKSLSGKVELKVIVENTEKTFTINIISGLIQEDLF
ncbi:MAG: BREX-4 system phosphatase PglZ [Melioribacteraceae bacterium]